MMKSIKINKKRYTIADGVMSDWALEQLVEKSKENQVTLEQMVAQSILQHWLQNDKFRQSDKEVLNTLLSLAYDFGYDEFKVANGKLRVLAMDEDRREAVAPTAMEL